MQAVRRWQDRWSWGNYEGEIRTAFPAVRKELVYGHALLAKVPVKEYNKYMFVPIEMELLM